MFEGIIASRLVRYSPDLNGASLADWCTFTDIVSIRTPTLLPSLPAVQKLQEESTMAKPIKHASYVAMKASVIEASCTLNAPRRT